MINRVIKPGMGTVTMHPSRRAQSLGQLDKEMNFGPQPLQRGDIPVDLLPRYLEWLKGMPGGMPGGGGLPDLTQLINDVHYIAGVVTLRHGLVGRIATITSTPQLIINCPYAEGRGYLILNPAGTTGLTATGTLVAAQTLVGATTLTSGSIGVANYLTARFFIESTVVGAGTVTVDFQTKSPATGNFITSQTVNLVTATPNAYVDLGQLGVDTDIQAVITVPAGTTLNLTGFGFVLKDGLAGTSTGITQTIFIGGAGVTSTAGYPILSGEQKQFYLLENVNLYAVTNGPSLDLNIFEL